MPEPPQRGHRPPKPARTRHRRDANSAHSASGHEQLRRDDALGDEDAEDGTTEHVDGQVGSGVNPGKSDKDRNSVIGTYALAETRKQPSGPRPRLSLSRE
jgi:hypothetical protein